jgi:acetyl esterase/lipase
LAAVLVCIPLSISSAAVAAAEGAGAGKALEVEQFDYVAYVMDGEGSPRAMTVYAPTTPGPWPTAVMLHGGGGAYGPAILDPWARAVAEAGAVVFMPRWANHAPRPDAAEAMVEFSDIEADLACSVRFARSEAERFGGDPQDLSLFGHSAGGHFASLIALTDPAVAAGCLAAADSAIPDELVLFEGDWLLQGHAVWDTLIAQDHAVWDAQTPWSHLAGANRLPVTILDSGDPSLAISTRERIDASLALRDPDGVLHEALTQAGALADERFTETEAQLLLADELTALGYPVHFVDLPDSSHEALSEAGLTLLTEALVSGPPAG